MIQAETNTLKTEINAVTEMIRIWHLFRQPGQPPFFDSLIHSSSVQNCSGSNAVGIFQQSVEGK